MTSGPSSVELWRRRAKVSPRWLRAYYREPIALVSGKGRRVRDAEGREYLDFLGGIATTALGYGIEEIDAAITAQLRSGILHTSTLFVAETQVRLAERLSELSGIPGCRVFLTNSGSEATEAAVLVATVARASNQVLALANSYHGWGATGSALTGIRLWRDSSLSPVSVHFLPGLDRRRTGVGADSPVAIGGLVEELRHTIMTATAGPVAALVVEPFQGAGGMWPLPSGLLGAYKEALDEFGILLVCDEVQTGLGRTGSGFFASVGEGVLPDLLTLAKGLGNGLPIGAVLGRGELFDRLEAGVISTFGGNPVAAASALATLDYLVANDLQSNAAALGRRLLDGLRTIAAAHDAVGDVRGHGLMVGIELVNPASRRPDSETTAALHEECRKRGLLIGMAGQLGNVLRLLPPLTVTAGEVDEALDIISDGLVTCRP